MMASVRNFALLLLLFGVACGDVDTLDVPWQAPAVPGSRPQADEPRYAAQTFALMENPVECPPPEPGEDGEPDQPDPTCSWDPNATVEEVEPRCFVPLGEGSGGRLRREIAQTFRVSEQGSPGRLRLLFTRLKDVIDDPDDPDNNKRLSVLAEIRDLGPTEELDENIVVPQDAEGSVVAEGFLLRGRMKNIPKDEDEEVIINLSSVEEGGELDPEHTYALVLSVYDQEDMAYGVGCHNTLDAYPPFSAYTRQMRSLNGVDYTDQAFIADTRTVVFSLTLNDGCTTGAMLECGTGVCYRNDWPLCVLGEFNDPCEPDETHKLEEEICDGLDNTCNGLTDDMTEMWIECDDPRVPAGNKSECYKKAPSCIDGVPQVCGENVFPHPPGVETCNGRDDDCDGITDNPELMPTESCGIGRCYVHEMILCGPNGVIECAPDLSKRRSEETCNGINDTCTEGVLPDTIEGVQISQPFYDPDNNYPGSHINGIPVGECKRGFRVCDNPKKTSGPDQAIPDPPVWDVEVQPVYPQPEQCNGRDDNCNGVVDDGNMQANCYDGPPGTKDVGECHGGIKTCLSQTPQEALDNGREPKWGACLGQQLPSAEVCDGKDNNCNGQTDEGLGTISCGLGICRKPIGACIDGQNMTCETYAAEHGYPENDPTGVVYKHVSQGGGLKTGIQELCNGLDDTCDGHTDQVETSPGSGQWVPITKVCKEDIPLKGECRRGVQTCGGASGWNECTGWVDTRGEADVCDNKDNNCNGLTDEPGPFLCPATPAMNVNSMRCDPTPVAPGKACVVNECKPGFYDLNGLGADGCECQGLIPGDSRSICSNLPIIDFPAGLTRGTYSVDGNMPVTKNATHWYRFQFPVGGNSSKGTGTPTIELISDGRYSMNIYYDNCSSTPNAAGTGVGRQNGSTHPDISNRCGEGITKSKWQFVDDCYGQGGCRLRKNAEGKWPTSVYVQIYRTDKTTPGVDCHTYNLKVSRQ